MLRDYAHERLGTMNSVRIFGTTKNKGAIVAFQLEGAHAHDVATVLDRQGIAVRAGTHCAQPLLSRYGVTSTCRASFGLYNTVEEIDKLAIALEKARSLFA
jgi:cysteine desulfurase/selenocysteine lyase